MITSILEEVLLLDSDWCRGEDKILRCGAYMVLEMLLLLVHLVMLILHLFVLLMDTFHLVWGGRHHFLAMICLTVEFMLREASHGHALLVELWKSVCDWLALSWLSQLQCFLEVLPLKLPLSFNMQSVQMYGQLWTFM